MNYQKKLALLEKIANLMEAEGVELDDRQNILVDIAVIASTNLIENTSQGSPSAEQLANSIREDIFAEVEAEIGRQYSDQLIGWASISWKGVETFPGRAIPHGETELLTYEAPDYVGQAVMQDLVHLMRHDEDNGYLNEDFAKLVEAAAFEVSVDVDGHSLIEVLAESSFSKAVAALADEFYNSSVGDGMLKDHAESALREYIKANYPEAR